MGGGGGRTTAALQAPTGYAAQRTEAAEGMGCPAARCLGYELAADLDFDTDGSGAAGPGDAFWNGGAGWRPLGTFDEPFTGVFAGNGRTVSHLFVGGGDNAGLFGMSSGVIRGVGVVDADVTGSLCAGGLVGLNGGRVEASWSIGAVTGDSCVGGLMGVNGLWVPDGGTFRPLAGSVTASWSAAAATAEQWVGGLIGYNNGTVIASYATGDVTATTGGSGAGGLVGRMGFGDNRITASYATGAVSGPGGAVGGLVGHAMSHDRVAASYWDTETSGVTRGGGGSGRTTAALQEPTGYTGPYAAWDVDVDGDGVGVAPVPWTPILLARRRSPRCRSRDRRTRRHSDSRWSSWFGPDVHRESWLGSSSRRPRRYETGSRRLIATLASAPTACAPKNMRRFVGCAGRTGSCAKNAKFWQKPRPGSRGRPDPGGLPVHEHEPGSFSRRHDGPRARCLHERVLRVASTSTLSSGAG